MKSTTKTLIEAMQILANEIHSEDGVANAAIFEASERLDEQQKRIAELEQKINSATDICNKALEKLTIPKEMSALRSEYFKAGITALAYAIEREAKQLKGGAE